MTDNNIPNGNDENEDEGKFVDSSITNGIGGLEYHIHRVFASVRVPGEDFVYNASNDLFNALEDFCDDQTMHEAKVLYIYN